MQRKGQDVDTAFWPAARYLHPEAQEAPAKQPPTFKGTFNKFGAEYERMDQAFNACFRKMNKETKKDDLVQFDQAWVDWISGSSGVRGVGLHAMCDAGDEKGL